MALSDISPILDVECRTYGEFAGDMTIAIDPPRKWWEAGPGEGCIGFTESKITKVLGHDNPQDGGASGGGSAEAEVLAKAQEIVSKGAGATLQDAIAQVLNGDPALYRRYRKESHRKSRGDEDDDE